MVEQALYEHLQTQAVLSPFLATYAGKMAIFSHEAPADTDTKWGTGSQYGRIIFDEDLKGDPERILGGILAVDILCTKGKQFPEDIEPIIKTLIHGWFFSCGTFVVAAQWKNSAPFTEPTNEVVGCTVTFELLAFPKRTTFEPDVVARINEWSGAFDNLHVINHDELPASAWQPTGDDSAIYWRCLPEKPARWIPDTYQTIWRMVTVKGHIFSRDIATAEAVARKVIYRLYAEKRLFRDGESPIMVNRNNEVDMGADPLRTGQLSIEATFGVVVSFNNDQTINQIVMEDKSKERRTLDGSKEPGIR